MTKYAQYEYVGSTEGNCYELKTGNRYRLAIYKMNWFERLFSKYPVSWYIVAYRPFEKNTCLMPYGSKAEFECNWKYLEPFTATNTLATA